MTTHLQVGPVSFMPAPFSWERTAHYPYPGPDFYRSNKVQYGVDYKGTFVQAWIQIRVNGPCTAYSRVRFSVEWASHDCWGLELRKHFSGPRAGQKARAWCTYQLYHAPSSWALFQEKKEERLCS